MSTELDDELWKLLDKASCKKASPMFAQDVLRLVRQEQGAAAPWHQRLLQSVFLWRGNKSAISWATALVVVGVSFYVIDISSFSSQGVVVSVDSQELAEELPVDKLSQELYGREWDALANAAAVSQNEEGDNPFAEIACCYAETLSEEEMQDYLAYL